MSDTTNADGAQIHDLGRQIGEQVFTESQEQARERIDAAFGVVREAPPEPVKEGPFVEIPWRDGTHGLSKEQAVEHILNGLRVAEYQEQIAAREQALAQREEGFTAAQQWQAFLDDPNNAPTVARLRAVLEGERLASEAMEQETARRPKPQPRPRPTTQPKLEEDFDDFLGEEEEEVEPQPRSPRASTRMPRMGEPGDTEPPDWAKRIEENQKALDQRLAAWDAHQRAQMEERAASERDTQARAILSRIDGALLGDDDLRDEMRNPAAKERLRRMVIAEMNATKTNDPGLAVKVIGDAQRERDARRMQSLLAGREKLERAHGTPPSGGSRSIPPPTTNEKAPSLANPKAFAAHVRRMTGL